MGTLEERVDDRFPSWSTPSNGNQGAGAARTSRTSTCMRLALEEAFYLQWVMHSLQVRFFQQLRSQLSTTRKTCMPTDTLAPITHQREHCTRFSIVLPSTLCLSSIEQVEPKPPSRLGRYRTHLSAWALYVDHKK